MKITSKKQLPYGKARYYCPGIYSASFEVNIPFAWVNMTGFNLLVFREAKTLYAIPNSLILAEWTSGRDSTNLPYEAAAH